MLWADPSIQLVYNHLRSLTNTHTTTGHKNNIDNEDKNNNDTNKNNHNNNNNDTDNNSSNRNNNEHKLPDFTQYFFERLDDIALPNYIPSLEDVWRTPHMNRGPPPGGGGRGGVVDRFV